MPIIKTKDPKFTLRCINHKAESTMRSFGKMALLRMSASERCIEPEGLPVQFFACKICGYIELYSAEVK